MSLIRTTLVTLAILIVSTFISCASRNTNYETLLNRGILPLSTTNPYVGTNLYLAHEFERSEFLLNFFRGRGAPMAIELEGTSHNPKLILYYPRQKEAYSAEIERLVNREEWIIRGPYSMERKDYRKLAGLLSSMIGEPVFLYQGEQLRFRFQKPTPTPTISLGIIPTPIPHIKPPVKKRVIKSKPAVTTTAPEEVAPKPAEPDISTPVNLDQRALKMSQGFAEMTEDGDVVHTVNKANETLRAIASWYTGTPGTAPALAKENNLEPGGEIAMGTRVKIPKSLVTQTKQMP